jgi:hypothetical protein
MTCHRLLTSIPQQDPRNTFSKYIDHEIHLPQQLSYNTAHRSDHHHFPDFIYFAAAIHKCLPFCSRDQDLPNKVTEKEDFQRERRRRESGGKRHNKSG